VFLLEVTACKTSDLRFWWGRLAHISRHDKVPYQLDAKCGAEVAGQEAAGDYQAASEGETLV
jgi:hypothetical protein